MARRVFYSFHYQADGWRASMVRNIGAVEGNPAATDNAWEEVKRGGDAAIQRWINAQLEGRSCTVVLVGAETASRRWVRYEIEKSWRDGKGVFGIRIHRLLNQAQQPAVAGRNPFESIVLRDGTSLARHVPLYDPPHLASADAYNYIRNNLETWIEHGISRR